MIHRFAFGVLAFATGLLAQPTIRVTTRLVEVNVLVHDSKGAPVADLKKDDFKVFDQGHEQKLTLFSVNLSKRSNEPVVKLPPNVFSNRIEAGSSGNVTAILFDALNSTLIDQAYARGRLIKFIDQIQPEDRVALYRLGATDVTVLHDFTNDAAHLRQVLQRLRTSLSPLDVLDAPEEPFARSDIGNAKFLLSLGLFEVAAQRTTDRIRWTLQALSGIAQHMGGIPGRKSLIWMADNFPVRSFAGINSVAVYPVDARGLMTAPEIRAGAPIRPVQAVDIETLQLLAERSGGRAFFNRNDLESSVRTAIDDSKVSYTLGYYPPSEGWDGKVHSLKVKVDRHGMDVRHRNAYFAEVGVSARNLEAELSHQLSSPLEATQVSINARTDIVDQPKPGTLLLTLQLSPGDFSFERNQDNWVGNADMIFAQYSAEGNELWKTTQNVAMNLTPAHWAEVRERGLIFNKPIDISEKAEVLKVMVLDRSTGSLGSIRIPLKSGSTHPSAAPAHADSGAGSFAGR